MELTALRGDRSVYEHWGRNCDCGGVDFRRDGVYQQNDDSLRDVGFYRMRPFRDDSCDKLDDPLTRISSRSVVKPKKCCAKCGRSAKGSYTPDIDIRGISFCKTHTDDVRIAYFALYHLGSDAWKGCTRGWWINKASTNSRKVKTKLVVRKSGATK